MALRLVGHLEVYEKNPYLYIITKANYIYIGQTQSNPVVRWNSHMQESGTFFQKLFQKDEEVAISNKYEINFYVFTCEEIKDYAPDISLERETEYAEGLLHERFYASKIAPNYTIISTDQNVHDSMKKEVPEVIVDEIISKFESEVYSEAKKIGNNLNMFNL